MRVTIAALATSAALATTALLAACGGNKPSDPNGVGPWQFGKSKLADAEAAGRCLPIEGGMAHCIGVSTMQVGGQPAEVQLYFASLDKKADLMEITFTVRTCDPARVAADLASRIGPPKELKHDDKTHMWTMSTMFVRAQVPEKGSGNCQINFVSPRDEKRIADLKAE